VINFREVVSDRKCQPSRLEPRATASSTLFAHGALRKTAKSTAFGALSADRGSVNRSMPVGFEEDCGTPRWMRLSINPSCQPEKPKNSHVTRWGSGATLGVELAPPTDLSSNLERHRTQEPAKCGGYGRRNRQFLLSTEQVFRVGAEMYWLPRKRGFQLPLHFRRTRLSYEQLLEAS